MEELLYRQMPHSLEAEQSVLGSMLIDANCIKDVMEKLGGGGNSTTAGGQVPDGTVDAVREQLIDAINEYLEE